MYHAETSAHGRRHERVYQGLRKRIIEGDYGPGYRIVVDLVADEFGVSATPVREAMRRLEAERLITYRANVGAQVAGADPRRVAEEIGVLAVLAGAVTGLAAPRIGEAEVALLTDINEDMVAAIAALALQRVSRGDWEFHRVICDACPNPSLVATLDRLGAAHRRSWVEISDAWDAIVREHRLLIQLFAGSVQPAIIEDVARQHVLTSLRSGRSAAPPRSIGMPPAPAPGR